MVNKKSKKVVSSLILVIVITIAILFAIFTSIPFIWAILSSFKTPEEIVRIPITFIPKIFTITNYIRLLTETNFVRAFLTSLFISITTTIGIIITSLITAYALSKTEFRFREIFIRYIIYLLALPQYLMLLPQFYIIVKLGWINNYAAIIIPAIVSPYSIFLLRQYILTIPDDFIDAARVDGAGETYIVFKIVLPLVKPAIIIISLWTFIGSWGSFLWPLIVLNDPSLYPLATYMNTLQSAYGDYRYTGVVMAGTVLSFLPMIIITLIGFKYIVRGITLTALRR